ncbi:hypothetical protein SNE40_005392 [Patella caerulea]
MSVSKNNTSRIRYAFFLGLSGNMTMNKMIETEAAIFNDILMEDFQDSYLNLTYKTLMGFKYVAKLCNKTKYILKTEDNMWINIVGLQSMLQNVTTDLDNAVAGACQYNAYPNGDKDSKWFASYQSFSQATYPGLCSGTGYVLKSHVLRNIYEVSKDVPLSHLEDVYISRCVHRLGYHLLPFPGFLMPVTDPCVMKSDEVITSHEVSPEYLKTIWTTTCD